MKTSAKERSSEELHEQILLQAKRLFVERGYKGLSMREIAEASNVSKAGLYYHFKDKEDLFLAILLESIAALGELTAKARAYTGSSKAKIRYFLELIAAEGKEQRGIMRLAENDAVHLSIEAQKKMRKLYHASFPAQLEAILAEGQKNSEIRDFDVAEVARILLSLALPLLSVSKKDAAERVDLLETIFFDGIAKR